MTSGRRAATPLAPINRDLAATAALALYSFAVGIGFARVFGGWAFLPHFLLLVDRRSRQLARHAAGADQRVDLGSGDDRC